MIRVDVPLLKEALSQGEEDISSIARAEILPEVSTWLRENIPLPELVDFIEEERWADSCQLCASYFHSARGIMTWTHEYESLRSRFVIIGSGPSGDFIAIPRQTFDSVGFVSHEEFGYDKTDLVKYIPISQSLGELYYNSWNVEDYPVDYYEAKDVHGT